jgi:hypothetical protein
METTTFLLFLLTHDHARQTHTWMDDQVFAMNSKRVARRCASQRRSSKKLDERVVAEEYARLEG